MGQHFLTECFLSENADLIQLKSCEAMWLFQWKCLQERIAMVEDNVSSKESKSEKLEIEVLSLLFRLFSWVLMIHFQDLQLSHLQVTDEFTRLQSASFSLSCWSSYISISDLTFIGLQKDWLYSRVNGALGLRGVWFPEPGLSDSQQWIESLLFNFFKTSLTQKKTRNILPIARSPTITLSCACVCVPALARGVACWSGVQLPEAPARAGGGLFLISISFWSFRAEMPC